MQLIINDTELDIEFFDTETAKKVQERLPLTTTIENRWGDEIYFYTDFKIPLSNEAKEIMEVGDIVYWRSTKSDKEAIAIFFGPTPKGDGSLPRAASPCDVIGRVKGDMSMHTSFQTGDPIRLEKSKQI